MNIVLWIVQIILGIKLVTASVTHGLQQSKPTMQEAAQIMGRAARPLHVATALLTLLGTLGLLLPGLLHTAPWLTPLSALLVAILLLLSIFFHVRSRQQPKIFVSVVLFVFAVFIAYGRWALDPLG